MSSLSLRLTPAITIMIEEITRSRLHGTAVLERARCILLVSQGRKFMEVASLVGLSAKAVGRWARRFAESINALEHVEQTQSTAALKREVLDCLRDAPRSGRPKQFSPAQVTSVISIACEDPEASGRPVTSWTADEIVDEAIKRRIVPSISTSQVQRFLARVQLRPHKNKGWCFTTEKDQELFQQQAELVCQTYLEDFAKHLQRLIQTGLADGWVFVVDNLNTHCGEPLVRMVAKYLGVPTSELGEVTKHGILKNMASRRAFLSDPSHQIRLVYTPKHSSWLNQIEAVFGMINRRVMRGR